MSHLCSRCATTIEKAFAGKHSDHRFSFLDLKLSADEKCYVCVRFWTKIQDTNPSLLESESVETFPLVHTNDSPQQGEAVDVYWALDHPHLNYHDFPLVVHTAIRNEITTEYLAPFIETGSHKNRKTMKQAQEWLSRCMSSHGSCSRSRISGLPTRLIKIGKINDQLCARVCDSIGLSPSTNYLTLSHCWGQVPFLTLTNGNFEEMKKSIPIDALPKLFQDALLITYELGFKYLWIDCLCIIQDSVGKADWLKECPTMDRVYSNSVCNLAATGYANGQEGLFPMCPTDELLPPRIECKPLGKDQPSISYYLCPGRDWAEEIEYSPLYRRAWVYQEQIMATRILHFTKKQIFWECSASKACEVFPDRYPPHSWDSASIKHRNRTLLELSQHLPKDDMYRMWLSLVENYSKANSTYARDRLPALSGLARVFLSHLQDEYLAGLWKGDLLCGLLWAGGKDTATAYRAPTWSWASVEGSVWFLPCRFDTNLSREPLAHIISAETIPLVAENTTDQVTGGSMLISGPIREVAILVSPESRAIRPTDRWTVIMENTPIDDESDARHVILRHGTTYGNADLYIYPSAEHNYQSGSAFLMPLLWFHSADGNLDRACGLVLHPREDDGQYEKCGVFAIMKDHILRSLFFHGHTVPTRAYESRDGHGNYTIRIL